MNTPSAYSFTQAYTHTHNTRIDYVCYKLYISVQNVSNNQKLLFWTAYTLYPHKVVEKAQENESKCMILVKRLVYQSMMHI